jgi:hypothetical protein
MGIVRGSVPAGLTALAVLIGMPGLFTASALAGTGPRVSSESVVELTPYDATLKAVIITGGEATKYVFEYATSEAALGTAGATSFGAGTLLGTNETEPAGPARIGGGLTPGTTYYYRVVATNPSGRAEGSVQSFQTQTLGAPGLEYEGIKAGSDSVDGATFEATVNPNYQPVTTCELLLFAKNEAPLREYDATKTKAPGMLSTPCEPEASALGSGGAGVKVTISPILAESTEYYSQLIVGNETGLTGSELSKVGRFWTLPSMPTATTGAVSTVTADSADLTGEVNPNSTGSSSSTTYYYFQYSTDLSYSQQVPVPDGELKEGKTPSTAGFELKGLEPATVYHYRLVAVNNDFGNDEDPPQVVYGEGKTFETETPLPVLGETAVSSVGEYNATITGSVDPRGLQTSYELRLGPREGELPFAVSGSTQAAVPEPLTLEAASLVPGTVYYYQVIATDEYGTARSAEGSFTTPPAPTVQTLPLQTFPQTPPLASLVPANAFGPEEAGTITKAPATHKNKKCSKGKKREQGKCVRAKAKHTGAKRKRRRG